jgi:hypothetical protein
MLNVMSNLLKQAFLSEQNVDGVFLQVVQQVMELYSLKLTIDYKRYVIDTMKHLYTVYSNKISKQISKKTVIFLNAITIKRILSSIIKFKPITQKKHTQLPPPPITFIKKGQVSIEELFENNLSVSVDQLFFNTEQHEWWSNRGKEQKNISIPSIIITPPLEHTQEHTQEQKERVQEHKERVQEHTHEQKERVQEQKQEYTQEHKERVQEHTHEQKERVQEHKEREEQVHVREERVFETATVRRRPRALVL